MTGSPVSSGASHAAFWWGYVLWPLFYAATFAALGVGLNGASLPVWNYVPIVLSFLWCLTIAAIWSVAFGVAERRARTGMSKPARARWLGIPILGVACLALIITGLPGTVRFQLSRGALEQAAVRAGPGQYVAPGWIGLEPIERITSQPDGTVFFQVPHPGNLGTCGLAYNPRHQPNLENLELGTRLADGWWTWCEYFD